MWIAESNDQYALVPVGADRTNREPCWDIQTFHAQNVLSQRLPIGYGSVGGEEELLTESTISRSFMCGAVSLNSSLISTELKPSNEVSYPRTPSLFFDEGMPARFSW
jgi:hypothetical protein